MDFSASSIFAGLFVGLLGTALFMYGKATSKAMPLLVGGAMWIYPFFITAVWMMLTVTAGLCVLLYFMREQA